MTVLLGSGFRLRRAAPGDAEFLARLASRDDVSPFLAAVGPRAPGAFREEIARAGEAGDEQERFIIEVDGDAGERPGGSIAFGVTNRRSRIAHLYGLMLAPEFRGRGLALAATRRFVRHLIEELDYHRVELECYAYNERAIRHFERAGFVREGVRRKAYWRDGRWVDGVLFGVVREDLDEEDGWS